MQTRRGEFLSGPNENVINADLQTRLKTVAEAADARLRAVQSLPPRTRDLTKYSGSRVEIYGSLQSIQRTVFAVESAKPYLLIVGASIKALPSSARPGVPEEPIIQAQLDVFGAIQTEARGP